MTTRYLRSLTPTLPLATWFLLLIPVVALSIAPTTLTAQICFCVAALVALILLKPLSHHKLAKFLLLALGSVIVLRYWLWRLNSTLPDAGWSADFILGLILFVVETYSIGVFLLNAVLISDPIRHDPPPLPEDMEDVPTVDILVPSYNEPVEMLAATLSAARNIIYPEGKFRVTLCDDGGTDQKCEDPKTGEEARTRRADLQSLCEKLGVNYTTRARNEHAKAGNLSAALQNLDGELVAVFDADHAPTRDFLNRTVGYFRTDPRLFLVQTPHFFVNQDPIGRNIGFSSKCPPENEMFYGQIHSGLDRWDGAFFCGSAAVLRRAALDEIGGFSGDTITEDAETALAIHARGWKSLYVNRAMIAGLQPVSFDSFLRQRSRWATGMIQLVILKNPLLRPGLSPLQRLCYLNSMSYWLFPVVRLVYLLAPLTYLLFGLQIFVGTALEALGYSLTYLVASYLTQNALFSRVRWPMISEIYEIAQAPYLFRAIVKTVMHPTRPTFEVTSKSEKLDIDHISPAYRPLLLLTALMALAIALTIWRWASFPGDHSVLIVVGSWAMFNFLLTTVALRSTCEQRERRVAHRIALQLTATLRPADPAAATEAGRFPEQGVIVDASRSGAQILVPHMTMDLTKGETILCTPHFPDARQMEATIRGVIHTITEEPGAMRLHLVFPPDQTAKAREAVAYMIFGDSDVWSRMRHASNDGIGLIGGILYFLWLAFSTFPKTLADYAAEPGRRIRHKKQITPQQDTLLPPPIASFVNPIPTDGTNSALQKMVSGRQA